MPFLQLSFEETSSLPPALSVFQEAFEPPPQMQSIEMLETCIFLQGYRA